MRHTKQLALAILAIGLLTSAPVFGFEPGPFTPHAGGQASGSCMAGPMLPPGQHMGPPHGGSMKFLMEAIEVNVLAQLTGQSTDNVRMMLVCAPPPVILDNYGVAPDDFRKAMDAKTAVLVKQAQAAGLITAKQAEDIQKRMSRMPAKPDMDRKAESSH